MTAEEIKKIQDENQDLIEAVKEAIYAELAEALQKGVNSYDQ